MKEGENQLLFFSPGQGVSKTNLTVACLIRKVGGAHFFCHQLGRETGVEQARQRATTTTGDYEGATFVATFVAFVNKYGIEMDPRYQAEERNRL